jgi:hypothetical protein
MATTGQRRLTLQILIDLPKPVDAKGRADRWSDQEKHIHGRRQSLSNDGMGQPGDQGPEHGDKVNRIDDGKDRERPVRQVHPRPDVSGHLQQEQERPHPAQDKEGEAAEKDVVESVVIHAIHKPRHVAAQRDRFLKPSGEIGGVAEPLGGTFDGQAFIAQPGHLLFENSKQQQREPEVPPASWPSSSGSPAPAGRPARQGDSIRRSCWCSQNSADDLCELSPFGTTTRQLSPAFGGEVINPTTSTTPPVGFGFPIGRNLAGRFEPVKSGVKRSFLEPQQPAASRFETPQDFQAVGLAAFQRRKDQRFKMTPQLVALDGFHAINIDRLGIKSMA